MFAAQLSRIRDIVSLFLHIESSSHHTQNCLIIITIYYEPFRSLAIKLIEVKQWLLKNFIELRVIAVRIFNVNVKTLTAFIRRDTRKKHE